MDRTGVVAFHGNGLTLAGNEIKVGDKAPDFSALDGSLKEVKLSDFKGQIVIISAVPSLDTPVCELQTKRFNDEASNLNAKVITISMDLPFAQSRFCESYSVKNLLTLSDFRDREFSNSYGLYMKELGLIARSIFIIDKGGTVVYREIVPEMSEQPNFDRVLSEAKNIGA